MNGSTLLMTAVILVFVAALAIALVAIIFLKKGKLNEKPGEFQFSKRKHIAGEGFVDTNIVKAGKTRTLLSFSSQGFIRWKDFFNPKNEEQIRLRNTAIYYILGFYIIAGLITMVMAYMDLTLGFYIGLLMIAYATLIIGINYKKYHK
jgi:hypothetical protein